jgi:hypothetical protein
MRNSHIFNLQVDVFMQRILACVAGMPDVSAVEVSQSGEWRPAGSGRPWLSVLAEPSAIAPAVVVKPEPDTCAAAVKGWVFLPKLTGRLQLACMS